MANKRPKPEETVNKLGQVERAAGKQNRRAQKECCSARAGKAKSSQQDEAYRSQQMCLVGEIKRRNARCQIGPVS